jgi:hypothetical protein
VEKAGNSGWGDSFFFIYEVFGYWVDYVLQIPWRSPLQLLIALPYVFLYPSSNVLLVATLASQSPDVVCIRDIVYFRYHF